MAEVSISEKEQSRIPILKMKNALSFKNQKIRLKSGHVVTDQINT